VEKSRKGTGIDKSSKGKCHHLKDIGRQASLRRGDMIWVAGVNKMLNNCFIESLS